MLHQDITHLDSCRKKGWFFQRIPIDSNGIVADILNVLNPTLLRHVVCLCVNYSLLAAWLPLMPKLPSIELIIRVLCIPEHQHHHTLHACHIALKRLCRIGSILKCYPIKLTLQDDDYEMENNSYLFKSIH